MLRRRTCDDSQWRWLFLFDLLRGFGRLLCKEVVFFSFVLPKRNVFFGFFGRRDNNLNDFRFFLLFAFSFLLVFEPFVLFLIIHLPIFPLINRLHFFLPLVVNSLLFM